MQILPYNYASEIPAIITSLKPDAKTFRFVIPSRKDRIFFHVPETYDVWTWQEIYEDINRTHRRRVISPPDHRLILRSILEEVLAEYPEKQKQFPGLTRPGFLSVISTDIRELLNEAVKPEQLTHIPESDNPSEFLLPEVYARYIEYLEKYNLLDSAQIWTSAYTELLKEQSWGRELVIVFVGFMSFNHGQLELVQGLNDRCRELIIVKPESYLAGLHDVSSQFGGMTTAKTSSGRVIEIPSAEPGLESEIIARTLALWADEGKITSFDDVGMMISAGREEAFAAAFGRYGVPYDFMSGVSISQTLPGRVLAAVRSLNTRNFPTYDTAMLFTQSCFAGKNFPVMRAYRAGVSGLDSWEEYLSQHDEKPFSDALRAVRAIRKFCDTLANKNTPARIMNAFREFLTADGLWLNHDDKISPFPELDESIRLTASAIQTVEQKSLALDELMPDLGKVQDDRMNGDEAYEFLEDWCRNTNTRAPVQISNAVRIFTGQPPVLAAFPVWLMTGITQKSWSGNITSSPLLGAAEREILHIPTLTDKAAQREALFRRLIHTGEKITVISRPELDDEGRPVSESPFMRRFFEDFPGWVKDARTSEGISILLGNDGFTFPEVDAGEAQPRKIPVIMKKAHAVGASDIHELLGCPFVWWQKKQAAIYEKDTEIAPAYEWGNMLHKYWECVWRKYRVDMSASGKIFTHTAKTEWQKLLLADGEDYGEFSRLVHDFRLKRKLKGITFRVNRLIILQSAIIDALHEAGYEHEKILLEDEAHLKATIDGVTFLGQCDRIEILRNPDGEYIAFIADYKEGNGANYEGSTKITGRSWNVDGREKFSYGLQLSVYAALFSECKLSGVYILGLEDGQISGSFDGMTSKIFSGHKSKKFNTDIAERISEGEYAMNCAVRVLKSGEFAPDYDSDLCRWCSVKSLCRKGEFKGEILQEDDD